MSSDETDNGAAAELPAEPSLLAMATTRGIGSVEILPGSLRLNIGCGRKLLKGFVNIDIVGEVDILCDVTSIPLPDGCASEAICIHCYEHIWPSKAMAALLEWRRLLKPGGLLVLELPDLFKACQNLVNGLPHNLGKQGIYGELTDETVPELHKTGYTPAELMSMLKKAGFAHIRQTVPQYHKVGRLARDMRIEAQKP